MGFVPFPAKIHEEVIPVVSPNTLYSMECNIPDEGQLPFWALISFGAYLLFKLGYGVLTFNDVPDAHAELMKQIDQAKTELRKKGVDVDTDGW